MLRLHLLRHAKTNPQSASGRDFDRALLPKGYQQLHEFKQFFAAHPFQVATISCSSALRTRQTYHELAPLFKTIPVQFLDSLYLASATLLLQHLNQLKCPSDLLLIGHNEGLSELASLLSDQAIYLDTCGYCCLEFPFEHSGYISAGTGTTVILSARI
ncbi:MAG: hypothetical protein RLZZ301_651 [Bacteroidota bacterium]|jgi:phosphohistidine phosphatase